MDDRVAVLPYNAHGGCGTVEFLETRETRCAQANEQEKRTTMHEVFPVLGGAAAALAVLRLGSTGLRLFALVALCVLIGAIASLISGELELSLGFVPVDVAQALAAGLLSTALAGAWRRGTARAR